MYDELYNCLPACHITTDKGRPEYAYSTIPSTFVPHYSSHTRSYQPTIQQPGPWNGRNSAETRPTQLELLKTFDCRKIHHNFAHRREVAILCISAPSAKKKYTRLTGTFPPEPSLLGAEKFQQLRIQNFQISSQIFFHSDHEHRVRIKQIHPHPSPLIASPPWPAPTPNKRGIESDRSLVPKKGDGKATSRKISLLLA